MWMPDISQEKGPTYLAVANAYAEAIERGDLPAGTRLPPQRDLAKELGVTVGTISRAYALMSKRELVSGEVGRGTFVRGTRQDAPYTDFSSERTVSRAIDLACFRAPVSSINAIIAEAAVQAANRSGPHPMHKYPPAAGLISHRNDGAEWLSRYGLKVGGDQVLICGGAQLALNVALNTFIRRGERVLGEAISYAGLRAICAIHEIELQGLEIDENGLVPAALDQACRAGLGSTVVVQPTLHNPTTALMPLERRREIAELAKKYDLLLIEDDTAGGMLMDRPPPIATLAPDHTIYINSVSKCMSPALRLGYMAAPRQLVDRLERVLHTLSLGAPPLVSDVMSVLLSSGSADRIIDMNFKETLQRQSIVAEILGHNDIRSRPGAFFAWLQLPSYWQAHEFVASALREGVNVTDGDNFLVDRGIPLNAVRISIDGAPGQDTLRHGLEILSRLLHQEPKAWMAVV
ncbi:MAG: hypothetical protein TEF_14550 [Rhizobiales bacterium NRL2]|jgi:DNA-binding transcriptional MocR family regulator|nr:MAG: hypothetical protein TEF_14550 [Rhizobiales bacterium NRL2]